MAQSFQHARNSVVFDYDKKQCGERIKDME